MSLPAQSLIGGVLLLALLTLFNWPSAGPAANAAARGGPSEIPVELIQVSQAPLETRLEAVGSTLAHQSVDIVPLVSGRVVGIHFQPGQQVLAGALLVQLDDTAQQADLRETEGRVKAASLALQRAEQLQANNSLSQADKDQLEADHIAALAAQSRAVNALAERAIRAPFAGVVGFIGVDLGARVDSDTVLTTLDDLSSVEVEFSVPEQAYGQLRPGQSLIAQAAAYPQRDFQGSISAVDSRIGESSRAFRVRASLANEDRALTSGMFLHVAVVLEQHHGLVIPEEAVLTEGSENVVYTVDQQRAQRRTVSLGQRQSGVVEILAGLNPGDAVVRQGTQRLRDGSPVRIAGATPAGEAS